MLAKLTSHAVGLNDSEYTITTEATIGAGRHNDIIIATPTVSSRHARILFSAKHQGYFVEDLKSRNGTKLDGHWVREPEPLENMNVVTIADEFDFIFQTFEAHTVSPPAAAPAATSQTDELMQSARTIIEEASFRLPTTMRSVGQPPQIPQNQPESAKRRAAVAPATDRGTGQSDWLPDREKHDTLELGHFGITESALIQEDLPLRSTSTPRYAREPNSALTPASRYILSFDRLRKSYALNEGENIVGRSGKCEIVVSHTSISRKHAVIHIDGPTITIRDLGSKNSTIVARRRIKEIRAILPGTQICFGRARAVLKAVP